MVTLCQFSHETNYWHSFHTHKTLHCVWCILLVHTLCNGGLYYGNLTFIYTIVVSNGMCVSTEKVVQLQHTMAVYETVSGTVQG